MQFSCVHSWFFNILKTISGPVAYQTPSPNTWCKTETTLKAATKFNMALEMPAKIPPLSLTLRDTGHFIKIPPLGCSKCRYLEFGCTECILRRDEVLSKVGIDTGEPFDVFRDSDVVT